MCFNGKRSGRNFVPTTHPLTSFICEDKGSPAFHRTVPIPAASFYNHKGRGRHFPESSLLPGIASSEFKRLTCIIWGLKELWTTSVWWGQSIQTALKRYFNPLLAYSGYTISAHLKLPVQHPFLQDKWDLCRNCENIKSVTAGTEHFSAIPSDMGRAKTLHFSY